jgi:restriction alleviation protein, Lar family
MRRLKPCPFCGRQPILMDGAVSNIRMVHCMNCGAIVSFRGCGTSELETIERWNTRSKDDEKSEGEAE